jgi:hypothetical protein
MNMLRRKHQILSDGKTVWVNSGEDGSCLGRFGIHGIDVHNDIKKQAKTGKQCLECTHTKPTSAEWERFRETMEQVYHVRVDSHRRPDWLSRAGKPKVRFGKTRHDHMYLDCVYEIEGKLVLVESGQYMGLGGVSNFFRGRYVKRDGTLGKEWQGYGFRGLYPVLCEVQKQVRFKQPPKLRK